LRLSWMYSLRRDSFVTKVLSWSRRQRSLQMVTDQIGNPIWARTAAEATAQVLAMSCAAQVGCTGQPVGHTGQPVDCTGQPVDCTGIAPWLAERGGIYHFVGPDYASRYEFAQAILRLDLRGAEHVTTQVLPALTAEFPTPARRPLFSALDSRKFTETFGLRLPAWEAALRLAMAG
jgi:dTDP-4-dehydrorhamnose reductase